MKRSFLVGWAIVSLSLWCVSPIEHAFAEEAETRSSQSFDELFKQWKSLLGQMRTLQEKYQVTSTNERPKVEAEFETLRKQGSELAPKLLAAAEKVFAADPKHRRDVGDFLMANTADAVRSENYEEGLRLAKLLIDHGYDDKSAYSFGGYAAYATDDFTLAKKYLEIAKEAGKLGIVKTGKSDKDPAGDTVALQMADQEALQWEEEQKLREAEAKADDLPRVKFTTSKGDIVIELFENEAPNTVANFISLVEKGFYNSTKFHRVIPGFMAQGGDPLGTGSGGPGYTIDCEVVQPNHRNHFRGTLSMAHAGRNTGGSQFFLTFLPTPHLDGQHTVFGRVIEGMDVLAKLQRTEGISRLGPPDTIIKAEVLRKRAHEYKPVHNGA
jgi:cyclophilin family peptidyl-prolyl cis-trans isomerase